MDKFYLAIDTSGSKTSLSLFNKEKIIDFVEDVVEHRQSKNLVALIDKLFLGNNISYSNIEEIIISVGPGSFTGIRVGLAFARGIRVATKIPVYCVSNFQTIACNYYNDSTDLMQKLVVMSSRKDMLYMQLFKGIEEKTKPFLEKSIIHPDSATIIVLEKKNLDLIHEYNLKETDVLIAEDVNALVLARNYFILKENNKHIINLAPLYVGLPNAKKSNKSLI